MTGDRSCHVVFCLLTSSIMQHTTGARHALTSGGRIYPRSHGEKESGPDRLLLIYRVVSFYRLTSARDDLGDLTHFSCSSSASSSSTYCAFLLILCPSPDLFFFHLHVPSSLGTLSIANWWSSAARTLFHQLPATSLLGPPVHSARPEECSQSDRLERLRHRPSSGIDKPRAMLSALEHKYDRAGGQRELEGLVDKN